MPAPYSTRWPSNIVSAFLALALACACAAPASAQSDDTEPATGRREPTRIYVGMWTTHLKHDVVALDNNWVIGATWRGLFGATFLNSFGKRAFSAGIQRTLIARDPQWLGVALGYRVGLVSGYDGRFMRMARDMPVLPFVQPFVTVDLRHVGIEVSYTFVVVSVAASYRF
jgi:hypothetical protein